MKEQAAVQGLLRKQFLKSREKNHRYSLRAFARRVGLSAGAISAILNGKRRVSQKLAERIAAKLLLNPQEKSQLLNAFLSKSDAADNSEKSLSHLELSAAQFRVIAQWEHFAILSLMATKGFRTDENWIGRRLGISGGAVKASIQRLIDLQMVRRSKLGRLTRSVPQLTTTDEISDLSIQQSHEEGFDLALSSLRNDPLDARDCSSITMPIDPQKMAQAKMAIRRFQDEISELLESGEKTEVYRLSIQLFPLTKIDKGENP